MKIESLSKSAFSTYEQCEFKYFLTYLLKYQDEGNPATLIGNCAHTFLEILAKAHKIGHPKDSKVWDKEWLWQICINHWSKKFPEIAKNFKEENIRKIKKGTFALLDSEYTPLRDNTIAIESRFSLEIDEPDFCLEIKSDGSRKYFKINGVMDRIDKIDDETIEIVDMKTGQRKIWGSKENRKIEPSDLHKDIQAQMYYLAATKLYPWAKNFIVTMLYLCDGGPVSTAFCNDDNQIIKKRLKKRLVAIRANNEPQRIKPHWSCNKLCSFGKNGICDEVWKEKQQFGYKFIEEKYHILNYKGKK